MLGLWPQAISPFPRLWISRTFCSEPTENIIFSLRGYGIRGGFLRFVIASLQLHFRPIESREP